MLDLVLDAMNIVALNGYAQNIAKIRETCKEASQLEILNERFQAEKTILNSNALKIQKWWSTMEDVCRECGDCHRPNGLTVCNDCYWNSQYELESQWEDDMWEREWLNRRY